MKHVDAKGALVPSGDEIILARGRLQPISGWPLKHIGIIETASPGFLWKAMHTRAQWRHAAFAAFASGILDDPDAFLRSAIGHQGGLSWTNTLADLGALLLALRPREVVEAALGGCPAGFMGALDKIGFDPLSEDSYGRLHAVFGAVDPASRRRRRCLEQLPHLSEDHLVAVEMLDPALLTPTILNRFPNARSASQLNQEATLVRLLCSTATDAALRDSLEAGGHHRFRGWFERWLQKVDMPLPKQLPTDPLPFLERITPATAKAIGEEFDNCLGRDPEGLTGLMMSGVFAMLAWREVGLLIEMTLLDDGTWMARRIHARSNATVTDDMRLKVRSVLEPVGVSVPIAARHPPELDVLIQQLGCWRAPVIDILDIG